MTEPGTGTGTGTGTGNIEVNIDIAFDGVETVIDIGPRTIVSPAAGLKDQTLTRARVKGCRECSARGEVDATTPPVYPTLNHRFVMVVGQEPTPAARKMLVTAMKNAKLGERPLDRVAVVHRVGCPTGTRNKKEWVDACEGHVNDAIWSANTNYVLLVGGDAKNLWRKDMTMQQIESRVGVMWDRYIAMVVPGIEGILQMPGGKKKDEKIQKLMAGLKLWRDVLDSRMTVGADEADEPQIKPVTGDMGRDCVECGRGTWQMDRDGFGWCKEHWDEGRRRWRIARGLVGVDGTEAMF